MAKSEAPQIVTATIQHAASEVLVVEAIPLPPYEPPNPRPVKQSTIIITGTPDNQVVYLDGQAKGGFLPLMLSVKSGVHKIECRSKKRKQPYKISVYARKGIQHSVDCSIEKDKK